MSVTRERASMNHRARNRRFAPGVNLLDERRLPSGGVTASLSHAVLSINGTSTSAPIRVDIVPAAAGQKPGRSVIVEGVAQFPAVQVRKIAITGVVGEAITLAPPAHRLPIPVKVSSVPGVPVPDTASLASQSGLTSSASSGPDTMSALEQQVVDLSNQARAQNGLPPLQVSSALVESAKVQSANMAQLNELDHTLPGVALPTLQSRALAVGYNYAWLGENIAFNYPDATSVVNAWMNSPEHRANILNPNFADIGVSFTWNSVGQAYVTEDFGSKVSA
jgi:uncharacterized protein YkwD